jgi:hypothetical protein
MDMSTDNPSFSYIEYGPHFFELVFADFEPQTIAAWLSSSQERYPLLRHAPWIRTLCDLREVQTLSPTVLAPFERVITRAYGTQDIRIAFLVSAHLIDARVQYSTDEYYGLHRIARRISRFFHEREPALDWLREGVPLPKNGRTAEPK